MNRIIITGLVILTSNLIANDPGIRYDRAINAARIVQISTATAQLSVTEWSIEGEPIILLHGGPGVPDYLEPVAEILKYDFHVISYDQRGAGDSEVFNASYSVQDHLEDLHEIINKFGFERVHLFGHSWGGLLAQIYANRYPEKIISLFLCNSATGIGADWKKMEKHVMHYNRKQAGFLGFSRMGLYSILAMIPGLISDNASRELFNIVWSNYFPNPKEAPNPDKLWLQGIRGPAGRKTRKSILSLKAEDLNEIELIPNTPVLILFGGYDIYGDETETLINRFPEAETNFLKLSGHLPWIQDRKHFIPVLHLFYSNYK